MTQDTPHFIDSPAIKGREAKYEVVSVKPAAVLKSWKLSLFSFEWLDANGKIRDMDDLPLKEREKFSQIIGLMEKTAPLERPVLGIGIQDNIEMGAGREVFLTLASKGASKIEVHIPVSCKKDFKQFIAS